MEWEERAGGADAAAPAVRERSPGGAFAMRLALAHFLAYPLLFWCSLTGMSVSILTSEDALLRAAGQTEPGSGFQRWLMAELGLDAAEAASFDVVMRPLLVVLIVLFVATHAAAVVWALAARRSVQRGDPEHERRGRRLFFGVSFGAAALITLAGAVGWLQLLLM